MLSQRNAATAFGQITKRHLQNCALLHLRRISALQRKVLNKLARGDAAVIAVEKRIFFRSTPFLPMTGLVGFFGTNYLQPAAPLNAFTNHSAFGLLKAAMLVLPAGMYAWMRRGAWT